MADVMEERVRSIQAFAGVSFTAGAVLLAISLALYPEFAPANQTNLILDALSKQDVGWWMGLHAAMVVGFLCAAVGFTAFAFLLHLRGASGPASVVSVCALIGGSIWAIFMSMEFFVAPFVKNLYPVDPGMATMIFNTVWFWKMGSLAVGAVLLFTAVIAAGGSAGSRGILPIWLGWGGAFFGAVGVLVYVFEFWSSTATGAAINPMRNAGVRYGVGLPLQVWMLAVGATLLRDYRERVAVLPPQTRTPVPPKREQGLMPRGVEPRRAAPSGPAPAPSEPPPLPPPIP